MYRGIGFDIDGTLVETPLSYIIGILSKIFSDIKITKGDASKFWFSPDREEFIMQKFGISREEFWEKYKKLDGIEEREKVIKVYDDVEHLKKLKEKYDLLFFVVSNAKPEITKMELKKLPINFDIVVNAYPGWGIRPKPCPDGISYSLSKLRLNKEQAIFVGNSDEDTLCARNAEVPDVLIERNEHTPRENPMYRIQNLRELEEIIKCC